MIVSEKGRYVTVATRPPVRTTFVPAAVAASLRVATNKLASTAATTRTTRPRRTVPIEGEGSGY